MATNLILDIAGNSVGEIPILGTIAATTGALAQTAANFAYDLQQIEAQKQAAIDAVNNPNYNTDAWIGVTQYYRDQVVIEDFQIGVDHLILPSVTGIKDNNNNPLNVSYAIKDGSLGHENGVWIEATIGNTTSNLVFIVNKYGNKKTDTEFLDEITNLFKGPMITTSNSKQEVTASSTGQIQRIGTYAMDDIEGQDLANSDYSGLEGSFELIGEFGDDFLKGNKGNDYLFGGFNSTSTPSFDAFTYNDDGNDTLQGGQGNDQVYGGTGNDWLFGGGYIYGEDADGKTIVTGVLTNDGTDTLMGGDGEDIFVFTTLSTGTDIIEDFKVYEDNIVINLDPNEIGNSVNLSYTHSGTDLTLSIANTPIAKLENIEQFMIASVFKRIEFISRNNSPQDTEGNDILVGGDSNDGFFGKAGDDWIYGGDGDDDIAGGWGNDIMIGGDGNDRLTGQENDDILIGGYGADTFYFGGPSMVGSDRILDFTANENDRIEIAQSAYGIGSLADVQFDANTGNLSVTGHSNPIATLENQSGFDVNSHVVLV